MSGIYPTDWMNREANLKENNNKRQAELLYWSRLRGARLEYAEKEGVDPWQEVNTTDENGFYYWMQRKYGVKLEFVDRHISGAYQVIDDKKFMFFTLKYPK